MSLLGEGMCVDALRRMEHPATAVGNLYTGSASSHQVSRRGHGYCDGPQHGPFAADELSPDREVLPLYELFARAMLGEVRIPEEVGPPQELFATACDDPLHGTFAVDELFPEGEVIPLHELLACVVLR